LAGCTSGTSAMKGRNMCKNLTAIFVTFFFFFEEQVKELVNVAHNFGFFSKKKKKKKNNNNNNSIDNQLFRNRRLILFTLQDNQ
jgi:hypothetical protein